MCPKIPSSLKINLVKKEFLKMKFEKRVKNWFGGISDYINNFTEQ